MHRLYKGVRVFVVSFVLLQLSMQWYFVVHLSKEDDASKGSSNRLRSLTSLHMSLMQQSTPTTTGMANSSSTVNDALTLTTNDRDFEATVIFDIAVPVSNNDGRLLTLVRSIPQIQTDLRADRNFTTDCSFRLLITRFSSDLSSDQFQLLLANEAQIPFDSVVLVDVSPVSTPDIFSRSRAINALYDAACDQPLSFFIVVDVDMILAPPLFINVAKYLSAGPNSIYFPIVFSEYEPEGIMVAQKVFGSLDRYGRHRGWWRDTGYGMFAVQGYAAKHDQTIRMDSTNFGQWGGEDKDLHTRVAERNYTIIREKEMGLIHKWHDKRCVPGVTVSPAFYRACLRSQAKLRGSSFVAELQYSDIDLYEYLLKMETTESVPMRTPQQAKLFLEDIGKIMEGQNTGSLQDCHQPMSFNRTVAESDLRIMESDQTVVSCTTIKYRANLENLRKSGSIIVAVLSSADAVSRRAVIRKTWAKDEQGVIFLVAGPWKDVSDEFAQEADMVWLDIPEDYNLISFKTAGVLSILSRVGTALNLKFTHLLKTDDDSYVALDRLKAHLTFLQDVFLVNPDYWGLCGTVQTPPIRDPSHKFYMSHADYPEEFYPRFCQGAGLLVSRKFVQCAELDKHIANIRFLRFEDVFVGMLAQRCGLNGLSTKQYVRLFRSGLSKSEPAVKEEMERVQSGTGRLPDGDWMPEAEMAGRIIQHRINSDVDMVRHHESMLFQEGRDVGRLQTGDVVEVYHDALLDWILVEVKAISQKETSVTTVNVTIVDDSKDVKEAAALSGLMLPFVPYSGIWRKTSRKHWEVPHTHLDIGIGRDHLPAGPKTQPTPNLSDVLLDRFIVVPEYKLLFCYMEKAGCSMFNHLFRMLRLLHPDMKDNNPEMIFQTRQTWFRNTPEHHSLNKKDLSTLLRDPTWKKAVFYRDPKERFLSAFRSKCEKGDRDGPIVCRRVFGEDSLPFEEALDRLAVEPSMVFSDPHFLPMGTFCGGLRTTLGYYDSVHELDKHSTPFHVADLLRSVGVPENVTEMLINSVVSTGGTKANRDSELIQELHGIPLVSSNTQAVTHNTKTSAETMQEYFPTFASQEQIRKAYSSDYELFEIPEPAFRRTSPTTLIGITTSRKYIGDRVRAIMDSWGQSLPPNVILRIYVGALVQEGSVVSGSREDVEDLARRAGTHDSTSIVVLDVKDDEYPLVSKANEILKHMAQITATRDDIAWVVDVDDDTYVNVKRLQSFLDQRKEEKYSYLGRRGRGRPAIRAEMKAVGMKAPYCMGGPGFALSRASALHLGSAIDVCTEELKSHEALLYDDVIIGICMYRTLSLGCGDDSYEDDVFVHLYTTVDKLNDTALLNAATLHDFKDPSAMVKLGTRYDELYKIIEESNVYPLPLPNSTKSKIHDDEDILLLDKSVLSNVRATELSSHAEIIRSGNYSQHLQTIPLMATVDRRPIVQRMQMMETTRESNTKLGCAFSTNTFVSDLEMIHIKKVLSRKVENTQCKLCFHFATPEDAKGFVLGQGEYRAPNIKCFEGDAFLSFDNAKWQASDPRFEGFGYIWNVDCTFTDQIPQLSCDNIAKIHDTIDLRDGLKTVRLETKFTLPLFFNSSDILEDYDSEDTDQTIDVLSEWPWEALASANMSRVIRLPDALDDSSSPLVPESSEQLSLLHVEGPNYEIDNRGNGTMSLRSTTFHSDSNGGFFRRFPVNLFHMLRLAPGSTHMIVSVDGQLHRTMDRIRELLAAQVADIFPAYVNCLARMIQSTSQNLQSSILPLRDLLQDCPPHSNESHFTIGDLLRWRRIRIEVVPILAPPRAFEKSVCGTQYQLTNFIAARYAADYHAIMYADADAVILETTDMTLQDMIYRRLFSPLLKSSCVGMRFRMVEQFIEQEVDHVTSVLNCTAKLRSTPELMNQVISRCWMKEGHIVARSDSVLGLNVHTPITVGKHATPGVEDCSRHGNSDSFFVRPDEMVEVHIRDRIRREECTCASTLAAP